MKSGAAAKQRNGGIHGSTPDAVREALRRAISAGELAPGIQLRQDELAEKFGTSRIPVREALRQLEAMGLVAMRTHRGAVVTTVPTEQVEELFELRALLEGDLLARAVPRLTDQDIAESGAIFDQLEASFRQQDMASWGRLNWAFHRRLYVPAHRTQTLAILEGINLQTERFIRLHLVVTDGIESAERDHRALLRLCALRDADRAVPFLREHILQAGRTRVARLRDQRADLSTRSV